MKVYKIKHLPTGLYYRPSAYAKIIIAGKDHYVKTNLSKKGKIYPAKPSLKWIGDKYYNHIQRHGDLMIEFLESSEGKLYWTGREEWVTYPYVESEWEIEEL